MDIPEEEKGTQATKTIRGNFSQEFYLSRPKLAEFLRGLADEVEGEGKIRISTDEWELPFDPRDQAEVEIELDDDELEIEIEFEEGRGGKDLRTG